MCRCHILQPHLLRDDGGGIHSDNAHHGDGGAHTQDKPLRHLHHDHRGGDDDVRILQNGDDGALLLHVPCLNGGDALPPPRLDDDSLFR